MKKVNNYALTSAFSMIELIFIIIILGILATVMKMNMPDNRLLLDINFIKQKIKSKQIYALSYDNFNYQTPAFNDDKTCIYINKDALNLDEKNSAKSKPYQINSKTTIEPNDLIICFDNLGRPFNVNNFINMPISFNIAYKDRNKTIKIMPFSGCIVKE
jgi:hypothetical protein